MKRILTTFLFLLVTSFSFAQSDSAFSKISLRLSGEFAVSLSTAYGAYYGLGNLEIAYHISPKYSIELCLAYDSIPMIDQKDFIKAHHPTDYNVFYSYSGGTITSTVIGALFKYDFYRRTNIHLYGLAGPSIYLASEKGISAANVLLQSKAPVMEFTSTTSSALLGLRFGAGCSYYIGRHCDLFLEADYQWINSSSSSISQLPLFLGFEYSF